jgi:hypothetical protein
MVLSLTITHYAHVPIIETRDNRVLPALIKLRDRMLILLILWSAAPPISHRRFQLHTGAKFIPSGAAYR